MPKNMIIIKKELRQNGIILVIPYLFLLMVKLAELLKLFRLSPEWTAILTVAVPVALAGAYGLQAFDSEENAQTRDFLLTKPITIDEVVCPKHLLGLSALLIFTFIWQFTLLPQSILLPDLFDLQSLWLTAFVLIIATIYNVSFIIGLMVHGPKKLLVAIFNGFIISGWVFYGWCKLATVLYRLDWCFRHHRFASIIILTVTIGLITIISLTAKNFIGWQLSQNPFKLLPRKNYYFAAILLMFPLCFGLISQLQKPVIQPFTSLAASFFKLEQWFVAVRGFKQPQHQGYAFIDSAGRIALTKNATQTKPQVVINPATPTKTKTITWSPDGSHFSFEQQGIIYTYDTNSGKTTRILTGNAAYWSIDNQQLLISEIINSKNLSVNGLTIPAHTIKFSVFDRNQQAVTYWAQIDSMTASALEWDSARELLLAVDPSWSLKLIHLKTGQVHTIDFLNSLPEYEIITYSQIIPSQPQPSAYDLIIYSRDKETVSKGLNRFNLRWYTFNPQKGQIRLKTTFKNIPATQMDLIVDTDNNRLLSNNGSGVYHAIKPSRR